MDYPNQNLDIENKHISSKSLNQSLKNSFSKSNITSLKRILVTHDGKDAYSKAINRVVPISKLSSTKIVLLRVIDDTEKIKNNLTEIQKHFQSFPFSSLSSRTTIAPVNIEDSATRDRPEIEIPDPFLGKMDETITKTGKAGCSNNKITYKFRIDNKISETLNEINTQDYDSNILTLSHIDSWLKYLLSNTRKVLDNVIIPVLIAK